tara:strand:+ start:12 stop:566 length:555 start_codon:yes stop_codon:yes gene_type:complete
VSIISKKEIDILLSWINKNKNIFSVWPSTPAGEYHYYPFDIKYDLSQPIKDYKKLPDLFYEIKKRIIKKYNIPDDNWRDGPKLSDYIQIITEGGSIPQHKDENGIGNEHLHFYRYNLFLSVPEVGGIPVYDGKSINVKPGDLVLCESGNTFHGATEVEGKIPRIIVAYSFMHEYDNVYDTYGEI